MKRVITSILIISAVFVFGNFFSVISAQIEEPFTCSKCGMDRVAFSFCRVLVTFEDGTKLGTCSIGCAHEVASDKSEKKIALIMVADYFTKELINVKNAVWVVGGNKPAVMNSVPEWAFSDTTGARKFIRQSGGKIGDFNDIWLTDKKEIKKKCCNNGKAGGKCCHVAGDTTSTFHKCFMVNNNTDGMHGCPMMNVQSLKNSSSPSCLKKNGSVKSK